MRLVAAVLAALFLTSCAEIGTLGAPDADAEAPGTDVETEADSGYVFDDGPEGGPSEESSEQDSDAMPDEAPEPRPLEMKPDEEEAIEEPAPVVSRPTASPEQVRACERKRGTLTKTGAGFYVCVQQTGQGQKACSSASDCKGACLARSGTCAPFTPLLGCNDIITERGGMATVCID